MIRSIYINNINYIIIHSPKEFEESWDLFACDNDLKIKTLHGYNGYGLYTNVVEYDVNDKKGTLSYLRPIDDVEFEFLANIADFFEYYMTERCESAKLKR